MTQPNNANQVIELTIREVLPRPRHCGLGVRNLYIGARARAVADIRDSLGLARGGEFLFGGGDALLRLLEL